jgi:hypothetical protein
LSEAEKIRQATQTILFLGTPHTGSKATKLASFLLHYLGLIAWMCGSKLLLLKSLEWHSEGLRDLDIEFSETCPEHISLYSFYETKDSYFGIINLGRIADFTSSTLIGYRKGIDQIKIDKNHTDMNKCRDDGDQTFVQICIAMKRSVYRAQGTGPLGAINDVLTRVRTTEKTLPRHVRRWRTKPETRTDQESSQRDLHLD